MELDQKIWYAKDKLRQIRKEIEYKLNKGNDLHKCICHFFNLYTFLFKSTVFLLKQYEML